MALMTVKAGQQRKLPPAALQFDAGAGWDPAQGQAKSPDLDLWIFRHRAGGVVETISWSNQAWHRPDLGTNSQGNPYIATPEGDVVHQGDDRTGASSATGYDEIVKFDLAKEPGDTEKYSIFVTIYDEKNEGLTLGMATNVKFGVTDQASGHTVETDPATSNSFDVSVALATLDKLPDGSWALTAVAEDKRGSTDDMFKIAQALGAK